MGDTSNGEGVGASVGGTGLAVGSSEDEADLGGHERERERERERDGIKRQRNIESCDARRIKHAEEYTREKEITHGKAVGFELGPCVGKSVGISVEGFKLGPYVGKYVGISVGCNVGYAVGTGLVIGS